MARSRRCASAAVLLNICLVFLAAHDSPVADAQGSNAALSHFLFDEWLSDVVPDVVDTASENDSKQPAGLRRGYDEFRGQSAASALQENRQIRTEISTLLRAVEEIDPKQNDSAERWIHKVVLQEMREASLKGKPRQKPLKGRPQKNARPPGRARGKAKARMGEKKRRDRKVPKGAQKRTGTMKKRRPPATRAKRQGKKGKLRKNAGGRRVAHKKGFTWRLKHYFFVVVVACVVLGVFSRLMLGDDLAFPGKFLV
ncbi:UNVERIFIED_CONTAM: hypothetical protein HHA_204000 [Hammondia hammondi]|eukprot:XP_008884681.1 hypothetical protein HHA_204000 [Hammondia hammondi]